jgi:hypothetical protein
MPFVVAHLSRRFFDALKSLNLWDVLYKNHQDVSC